MNSSPSPSVPAFRIEIPSVEHPRLLRALIEEAAQRRVPVRRISQGSGLQLLTDAEVAEMLGLAREHGIEVFLFISPRNSFEPLVDELARDELRGEDAFADGVADLRRSAELGIHGVLVADVGLLAVAGELSRAGELGQLQIKTSVAIAPRNAAAAALYEQLGATSINVASSSTLDDLAAMRARLDARTTLDLYVESSDGLGGGLRYREAAAFVRELAPVSLKIGLRKMPDLYPYGLHLEPAAEQSIREKVRRAEILLERLRRELGEAAVDGVGASVAANGNAR